MLLTATIGTLLPAGTGAGAVTPAVAQGAFATSGITTSGAYVADVVEVHDFFTAIGRIGYEDLDFAAISAAPAVTAHDSPGGFA